MLLCLCLKFESVLLHFLNFQISLDLLLVKLLFPLYIFSLYAPLLLGFSFPPLFHHLSCYMFIVPIELIEHTTLFGGEHQLVLEARGFIVCFKLGSSKLMLLHLVSDAHSFLVVLLRDTYLKLTFKTEDFVTYSQHCFYVFAYLAKLFVVLAFVSFYPELLHIF